MEDKIKKRGGIEQFRVVESNIPRSSSLFATRPRIYMVLQQLFILRSGGTYLYGNVPSFGVASVVAWLGTQHPS